VNRRNFLRLNMSLFSIYASSYIIGCGDTSTNNSTTTNTNSASNKALINTTSLSKRPESGSFDIIIENTIPSDLKGTLYRNGPSIFERNGVRKNHILDGDGFITALNISDSKATFKGEFVKTSKFIAEENAGEFLFDTWDFANQNNNIGILSTDNDSNQSSVSVKYIDGTLYTFDESAPPYLIDTNDLSAKLAPDPFAKLYLHSAHGKKDSVNGDFVNFGIQYGDPTAQGLKKLYHYLHISIINKNKIKFYKKIELGGILNNNRLDGLYFHDFFITKNYIIFNLQPLFSDIRSVYPINKEFGEEETSLAGSYRWDEKVKNKIVVADRHNPKADVVVIDTPSTKAWWHSSNAYEEDNKIILDFITYDKFDFFDKKTNSVANIATGSINEKLIGTNDGYPTRHIISLSEKSAQTGSYTKGTFVSEDILNKKFACEFSTINNAYLTKKNNFFYAAIADNGSLNGIGRFNNKTNNWDGAYLFPKYYTCGEPIFCPKDNSINEDDGYLISTVHNLKEELSFVAIFDSKNVSKGAVAKVHLNTSLPMRLHGEWVGE